MNYISPWCFDDFFLSGVNAVSPLRYIATKPKITIEVDRYIITGKILSLMKAQIVAAVSPPIIRAATKPKKVRPPPKREIIIP